MSRHLATLVLAAAGLACTACGFHLRGWDLAESVSTVHVAADARNPMELPLTRALEQSGVALTESADEAELVVALLDSRRQRRSVSVSGRARAAEYEVSLGVRYQVTDAGGDVLVPAQWLERDRVFRVDRDNLVGSSEEQALLEGELETDLVQQIMRTLNAVAEESEDAT